MMAFSHKANMISLCRKIVGQTFINLTKNQCNMRLIIWDFKPYYVDSTRAQRNSPNDMCYDRFKFRRNSVTTNSCLRHNSNGKKILSKHHRQLINKVIQEKQAKFRQTEQKIRKGGRQILADIKETKEKMKEKMEEVIERENVWTVPNMLCLMRIALSPYIGHLIIEQEFHFALGLVTVAGITDLLDGWIARTFKNQSSMLGSFLDPVADKVLIATMFVTLTYVDLMPVYLTGLIITRDLLLVGAASYIRYQSLPLPRSFAKYFDVTLPTAQLAPTGISKMNTLVQLATVASTLAAPVFGFTDHPALLAAWYVTGTTTVASALSYAYSKNTYRIIRSTKKKKWK